jgi:regulator of protease activity HflC (stomatin/prohibitin superfamily)
MTERRIRKMQIHKPSISIKSLPKSIGFHPDFRFGPVNAAVLVILGTIAAIIYASVASGETLPGILAAVLGSLAIVFILRAAPLWESVIIGSIAIWVVMHLWIEPMYEWLLTGTLIGGSLIASAIQIAQQWEKGVVLRLGKFRRLSGPGLFLILPITDKITSFVDHRVRTTDFSAETTLTMDTVPVDVDAIAFWMVWDAQKSVLEVEKYEEAVTLSAQTALRNAIGKHALAELLSARDRIGEEIQRVLIEKTEPWGITVQTIEIRDITIPKGLEDAMSKEAQAERERQARIILGTAETEIAEKFSHASKEYLNNPTALHLRAMNMVFEGLRSKGSMVIVPSSAVDSMNLGALGGLTAFAAPHLAEAQEEEESEADTPDQEVKA